MCGIAGYSGFSPEAGRPLLEKMAAALKRRGPEDGDFFFQGPVGLGHTRLKIIDPEGGRQPLYNEARDVVAVVNGEIYNFMELRKELSDRGHKFYTRSDAEAVVHLYEEHGPAFPEKLDGMFAIALYDIARDKLVLARDRLGKKPLHYITAGNAFCFASEIKALLTLPAVARRIHLPALVHYLSLQYVPDTQSIFEGIDKVQPGELLVLEHGRVTERRRYWTLNPAETNPSAEERRERIRTLVSQAVKKRMIADVPLGVFLSGGIDSSIVTALLSSFSGKRLKTYSIGFLEEKYSELPKAGAVAKQYGTQHHEFVLSLKELKENLISILSYFDEPLADPSALPLHYLCNMAKKEITVALTGDGGDELFAGYQRYRLDRLLSFAGRLPGPARGALSGIADLLRVNLDVPVGGNFVLGLKRLGQALSIPASAGILRLGSYFNAADLSRLFRTEVLREIDPLSSVKWLTSVYEKPGSGIEPLNRTLYTDLLTYAPGDYLVKSDRMSMSNALEIRCPLLDIPLAEYAFSLASSSKTVPSLKALLKDAFKEELPKEVAGSPKQGFTLPIGLWMNESWLYLYKELAAGNDSMTRTYFDDGYIATLMQEHQDRRNDHGKKLYALLCLEIWAQCWLGKLYG
jgi:asparagine synthase (glutamine-hydrolysing)